MDCPKPEDLVVITADENEEVLQRILADNFQVNSDGNIALSNKYYSAVVPVHICKAANVLSDELSPAFCLAVGKSPALSFVISNSEDGSIAKCKEIWTKLGKYCSETAVVIMFIEKSSLSETETYKLVDWGLANNIEIVTEFLCSEDEDTDIVTRIEKAFECAPWPQVSTDVTEANLKNLLGETDDDADDQEVAIPDGNVLPSTRLRRGLNDSDVSNLINQLLLDEESDSDD